MIWKNYEKHNEEGTNTDYEKTVNLDEHLGGTENPFSLYDGGQKGNEDQRIEDEMVAREKLSKE